MQIKNLLFTASIGSTPSQSYGQKVYIPSTDNTSTPLETLSSDEGGSVSYLYGNLTQSWSGSYNTKTGLVPYIQSTKDEFITGEYSGSIIKTTDNGLLSSGSFSNTGSTFFGGQFDILINNALQPISNSRYMQVDYNSGILIPVNQGLIISGSASLAELNQYNYEATYRKRTRYEGIRTRQQFLNKYTPSSATYAGDTSHDNTPDITSYQKYFAYFDWSTGTEYELMNKTQYKIRFLIDEEGNTFTPALNSIYYWNLIRNFEQQDPIEIIYTESSIYSESNIKIYKSGKVPRILLVTENTPGTNTVDSSIQFGTSGSIIPNYGNSLYKQNYFNNSYKPNGDISWMAISPGYSVPYFDEGVINTNVEYNLFSYPRTSTSDIASSYTSGNSLVYKFRLNSTYPQIPCVSSSADTDYSSMSSRNDSYGQNTGSLIITGSNETPIKITLEMTGRANIGLFYDPFTEYDVFEGSNSFFPNSTIQVEFTLYRYNSIDGEEKISSKQINFLDGNYFWRYEALTATIPPIRRIGTPEEYYFRFKILNISSVIQIWLFYYISVFVLRLEELRQTITNLYPASYTVTPNYWTTGSSSNNILTGSNFRTNSWGNIQNLVDHSGYNEALPFIPQIYDEIRFEGDEYKTYIITNVIPPTDTGDQSIYLTLNKDITPGTNLNSCIIRRYVEDPNYIILDTKGTPGEAELTGLLYPENMDPKLREKIPKIIHDLKEKRQIP